MKCSKITMNEKEVIEKSLQKNAPTAINMHKIEEHFIMDINYEIIVNSIIEDLKINGYVINNIKT